MLAQIDDFKHRPPAYDPLATGTPSPSSSLLKTYLTLFPNVDPQNQCPLLIRVRDKLKPEFMKNGMMLGEFFHGNQQPSLYGGPKFKPLSAPISSFAIRYMVEGDRLFATTPQFQALHGAYFPPKVTP